MSDSEARSLLRESRASPEDAILRQRAWALIRRERGPLAALMEACRCASCHGRFATDRPERVRLIVSEYLVIHRECSEVWVGRGEPLTLERRKLVAPILAGRFCDCQPYVPPGGQPIPPQPFRLGDGFLVSEDWTQVWHTGRHRRSRP